MDLNLVFAKTAAGEEAVQQRTRLVQRNLRTVLIVVDGRSSVGDLCERVGGQELVETALEQLEREGYIEPVIQEVAAPDAPEEVTATEHAAPPPPPAISPFLSPEESGKPRSRPRPTVLSRLRRRLDKMASDARSRRAEKAANALAPSPRGQHQPHLGLAGWLGIGAASLILILVVGVLAFPYGNYRGDIEASLSTVFGQPVKVGSVYGTLSPMPLLVLERVRIGDNGEVEIRELRASPTVACLLGSRGAYRSVVIDGLSLPAARLSSLLEGLPKLLSGEVVSIRQLAFSHATIGLGDLKLEEYSGVLLPAEGDKPLRLSVSNAPKTLNLELTPGAGTAAVRIDGNGWKPGDTSPLVFDSLTVQGQLRNAAFVASKVEGRLLDGLMTGQFAFDWEKGLNFRADLGLEQASGRRVTEMIGSPFRLEGELNGRWRVAAGSDRIGALFDKVAVQGDFVARRGSLQGIDLVEAVRRGGRGQTRGGTTRFDQLSGRLAWDGQALRLTAIELLSGALRASGNLTVGREKQSSGSFNVQLKGGTTEVRSQVTVSGPANSLVLTGG